MLTLVLLAIPAKADTIRWVDFDVGYEALRYAMEVDIKTFEEEHHISWIDILALAACRTGGKCPLKSVRWAAEELQKGRSPRELMGDNYKYFRYYRESYQAVLGGLLGSYAIEYQGQWKPKYGLKAFSPIAEGFSYTHSADFGTERTFGFQRKHLGNDLMGTLGTPIVAVEGGIVEAMGWNRYGGWRVGIRSADSRRYYYYAHLRKDAPFAPGLQVGDVVQAGDLIGFMGRTGYSDEENVDNIQWVHLHLGLQLVFDESQKECDNEIWVDVYDLVKLLEDHRSSLKKTEYGWQRIYPYRDLDVEVYP